MIFVVDASIVVKWFVAEDGHSLTLSLLEHGLSAIAPDLIFSETANVLWKKLRRGEVTSEQAERACGALPNFFEGVVSTASLVQDALGFATRLDHPVYDCIYLACAERQGTKLVTADQKFIERLKAGGLRHLVISLHEASSLTPDSMDNGPSISDTDLKRVIGLSERFERTLSSVREPVESFGQLKWVNTADLQPAFDSPAYRRLMETISSLSHDNLRDLVALAWLGRGYDGNDWNQLREQADATLGDEPAEHSRYIGSLLPYVRSGIQKISNLDKRQRDQSNPKSD